MLKSRFFNLDWILIFAVAPLLVAGLITMKKFGAGTEADYYFIRQIIWIFASVLVFLFFSSVDWRFLKKGELLVLIYLFLIVVLVALFFVNHNIRGTSSWISFGFFSIEPSDFIKLAIILILAKYFSRRHIEIAHIRHIIISALYVFIPAILVFLQPDFGSALVLFLIWMGMILISGISKKHLLLVFLLILLVFSVSWLFIFKPYQKERILNFLDPLRDVKGAGYNANQSMIAVGSGQLLGKGIGFGTQSRLEFLPEHQTDFIFAAFAEEWGMVGVIFIFIFFGIVIWRILKNAFLGQGNFECLFGIGLAIFLMAHFAIHVGMNIGLMPITGIGMPFMSYGGSNLLTVFIGLGILMGMRKYSRQAHREDISAEFLGPK